MLLDHKANIEAQDKQGLTPLHIAEQTCSLETIGLLTDATHNRTLSESESNMATPIYNPQSQSQSYHVQYHFDGIREVCFPPTRDPSLSDRIKSSIEAFVAGPIDWWPFSQPYIPPPADHLTVMWKVRMKTFNLAFNS